MSLPPGSTIGILGGGQLGRMMAIAAARIGYRCHIFDPHEQPCAAEVSARFTRAAFDDVEALNRFAAECDVGATLADYRDSDLQECSVRPACALAGTHQLHGRWLDGLRSEAGGDCSGRTCTWSRYGDWVRDE